VVKIGRLTDEITSQLRKYSNALSEDVNQITDDLTKEAVVKIKDNIRKAKLVKTGNYLRGWTRKKVPGGFVIHNRTDYQLTHLLEYGHAMENGGRTTAIPHIRTVEEWVVDEYEKRIDKAAAFPRFSP
jgi:Bacteriophage HK97-gp10, putative tail-component